MAKKDADGARAGQASATDAVSEAVPLSSHGKNAFSMLMAPKRKRSPVPAHRSRLAGGAAAASAYASASPASGQWHSAREALGSYIARPEAFIVGAAGAAGDPRSGIGPGVGPGPGQVIYFSDDFVAIHDKFPKAAVHCLLLPRDPHLTRMHPLWLGQEEETETALRALCAEAEKLRAIVAAELQRRFGQFSAADAQREAFMRGGRAEGKRKPGPDPDPKPDSDPDSGPDQIPPGRDWRQDVRVGVHARPSMNHLHVHVLSRDMHGAALRHRRHYNSFTTPFFVGLDELPLARGDPRQPGGDTGHSSSKSITTPKPEPASADDASPAALHLRRNLVCWRCHRDFGNRFQELQKHLDHEFDAWKRE